MRDELVNRLRANASWGDDRFSEAADRIEALTAERDGLLRCVTDNHVALCRAEKAEAERDLLREALEGLMAHEPDYSDTLWQDARTALKGETK